MSLEAKAVKIILFFLFIIMFQQFSLFARTGMIHSLKNNVLEQDIPYVFISLPIWITILNRKLSVLYIYTLYKADRIHAGANKLYMVTQKTQVIWVYFEYSTFCVGFMEYNRLQQKSVGTTTFRALHVSQS